jgi:hypothetical protein
MDRYDFECDSIKYHVPDGDWVKYEDAKKLLNALKKFRGQYAEVVRFNVGVDVSAENDPYIAEVDAVITEAEKRTWCEKKSWSERKEKGL